MTKVLITGASGLIGSYLKEYLSSKNFEISILSRNKKLVKKNSYWWDIKEKRIEAGALENVDYVIHLAGAGIADKRWTDSRKQEIIESRVDTADLIYNELMKTGNFPKAFFTASAIGYYGAVTTEKIFEESDPPGNDFQAEVCKLWEESTQKYSELGIRTIQLRFGIVLSANGGALKKMLLPAKLGIGSPLGSGRQFFPWIHIKDAARAIHHLIENENLSGPFNIVAPNHVNYKDFSENLSAVLKRPHFAPNVPSFLLKILFGEMSEIILEGSRISSDKLSRTGFNYEFSDLDSALSDLLINPK